MLPGVVGERGLEATPEGGNANCGCCVGFGVTCGVEGPMLEAAI